MMRIFLTIVSLLWCGMSVSLGEGDYRTFTDVFGQKTEAQIVKVERGQVHLIEKNGGALQLPLKSLSKIEQSSVREWIQKGGRPTRSGPAVSKPPIAKHQATPKSMAGKLQPSKPADFTNLIEQASLAEQQGDLRKTEAILLEAERLSKHTAIPESPEMAKTLNRWGILLQKVGRFKEGHPRLKLALAIREEQLGQDHSKTGESANNLGMLCLKLGRYVESEALLKRALKTTEAVHGPDHLETASQLNNLGGILSTTARYEEAEKIFIRALEIIEAKLGPTDIQTANPLNNLASLYKRSGRITEAESLYRRALAIQEERRGPGHPITAVALNNLAGLYQMMGRYAEAEPLIERALNIQETTLGPTHPSLSGTINSLGTLCFTLGRHKQAASLFERALKIRQDQLGPNHPDTAESLHNLAVLYEEVGNYKEAELLYRQALEIEEKLYGEFHPDTVQSLNNLAVLFNRTNRINEARQTHERALMIREKIFGPDHFKTAESLHNLGAIANEQQDYKEAERCFERALKITESLLGPHHLETALGLKELAWVKIELGKTEEATELTRRYLAAQDAAVAHILTFASEKERLAFRVRLCDFNLVASLEMATDTAKTVLRHKGLVLESLLEDRRASRQTSDPKVAKLGTQLTQKKAQLRLAVTSETGSNRVGELGREIEHLEKALTRSLSSAGTARWSLSLTVADVQKALPEKAALVEYFYYLRRLGNGQFEPSIGAVVIRNGLPPSFTCCVSEKNEEGVLGQYRRALENIDEDGLKRAAKKLHAALIAPIQKHLNDAEQLIISPDAGLDFIPFAALLDQDERFLAERFEIRYVLGGRDLLKDLDSTSPEPASLIGGVDFKGSSSATQNNADQPEKLAVHSSNGRGTEVENLRSLNFPPLSGTKEEVTRVAAALASSNRETVLLQGDAATEEAIRTMRSPSILHLATHGFFLSKLPDGIAKSQTGNIEKREDKWRGLEIGLGRSALSNNVNPMYRSGIALAGAQNTIEQWRKGERPAPGNDGILMAAEVGDLNLRGTDLVTLSACSTGIGESMVKEGIYGLRRGFAIAGARNLITTLWPVADEETADFMEDFYTRYAATGNAPKSLAEVQREWLVRLREEKGLVYAVNRAGPFIMSSQGRID